MKTDSEVLRRIEALPQPRHLFILPSWADPLVLDKLINKGLLACNHVQRDERGLILLAMNLELTPSGQKLADAATSWAGLALMVGSVFGQA